ncbi:hypothetical protein Ciccas_003504 [Cichlidogyrus casuarinus]|uniref:NTR domain-containing protein n=1 Tax=Cichlidogyrus casuarinus TaxID=1844966 RepID=A0ABD2QE67_9PLAT
MKHSLLRKTTGQRFVRLSAEPNDKANFCFNFSEKTNDIAFQHLLKLNNHNIFANVGAESAVFLGEVLADQQYRDAVRYEISLKEVWKAEDPANKFLASTVGPVQIDMNIWVPKKAQENAPAGCMCPRLENGNKYLFFAHVLQKPHMGKMELQLVPEPHAIIPWREYMRGRLTKMITREKRNGCANVPGPRGGARVNNPIQTPQRMFPNRLEAQARRRLMRESPLPIQAVDPASQLNSNPYLSYTSRNTPGLNAYQPHGGYNGGTNANHYNSGYDNYPNRYYAARKH